jgi:hypothetical protein
MDVKELRIGNWIQSRGYERQVREVYTNRVLITKTPHLTLNYIEEKTGIHIKSIEPIPLTEEWLIKYGFKYDGHTYYSKKIDKDTQFSIIVDIGREKGYLVNIGIKLIKLDYVHKLQNLYFELRDEELTMVDINKASHV